MVIQRQLSGGKQNFCKVLTGNTLFSGLYCTYTIALRELKVVPKANIPAGQSKTPKYAATQEHVFREVWRSKRHSTNETAVLTAVYAAVHTSPEEASTRNLFIPLRACDVDADSAITESSSRGTTAGAKTGRRPPIVLTSAVKMMKLQKHLKRVVIENFEFCSI
jgi:hypothetical protein